MKGYTFILTINLDSPTVQNQHDVAAVLRHAAEKLDRFVSSQWNAYSASGELHDLQGREVGGWEVKGPHDDNDE